MNLAFHLKWGSGRLGFDDTFEPRNMIINLFITSHTKTNQKNMKSQTLRLLFLALLSVGFLTTTQAQKAVSPGNNAGETFTVESAAKNISASVVLLPYSNYKGIQDLDAAKLEWLKDNNPAEHAKAIQPRTEKTLKYNIHLETPRQAEAVDPVELQKEQNN